MGGENFQTIGVSLRDDKVAFVTLARPLLHNAFNETMIAELTAALADLGEQETVRAVVLQSEGKSFSAGGDIDWMRRMAGQGAERNLADAGALAGLMRTLNFLPKPTIARVQGAAFGGGVGLVACCDMAVAAQRARFCLSEVRLGLIPSVISPYVAAAIGPRQCRRLFLTAEAIDAGEALAIGLVHRLAAEDRLDEAVESWLAAIKEGAPGAQAAAKQLVFDLSGRPLDEALSDMTARRIADLRAAPEGREGLTAFLEKRPPAWKE